MCAVLLPPGENPIAVNNNNNNNNNNNKVHSLHPMYTSSFIFHTQYEVRQIKGV
jgi:hypothetical protein